MADIRENVKPEVLARLREIARTCMELQAEAGLMLRGEAERLADEGEDFEAMQIALAQLYHDIALAAGRAEAKLLNMRES